MVNSKRNNHHLPRRPAHGFHGRRSELLQLEQSLIQEPYAVIVGQIGLGKSALAVELAQWLESQGRFGQALYVSLDQNGDVAAVLDCLGQQLLPKWVVGDDDLEAATNSVIEAMGEPVILVFDQMEAVLEPPGSENPDPESAGLQILAVAQRLLNVNPANRLLFTGREPLPQPFDQNQLVLDGLSEGDGTLLIEAVLAGVANPQTLGDRDMASEIELLNLRFQGHARALVLLAPLLAMRSAADILADLPAILAAQDNDCGLNGKRSLYAAMLSALQRLPASFQNAVQVLAVFHGGFSLGVLEYVLELDEDAIQILAAALIDVGLASDKGHGFLRIDPGLPVFLRGTFEADRLEKVRERWAEAMGELVLLLHGQEGLDDPQCAALSELEVDNFLALLARVVSEGSLQRSLALARNLESLWAPLNLRHALARAVAVRKECYESLGKSPQPWLNWYDLFKLERSAGNIDAAHHARDQARSLFLAYRHGDGQNDEAGAALCAVVLQQCRAGDAAQLLARWRAIDVSGYLPEAVVRLEVLKAILGGDRNPSLADDPNLHYKDAVEIQLLLETLALDSA